MNACIVQEKTNLSYVANNDSQSSNEFANVFRVKSLASLVNHMNQTMLGGDCSLASDILSSGPSILKG